MAVTTATHAARVTVSRNDHGYPYTGVCSCGWTSWGYVREHAAQTMVDVHTEEVAR